MKYLIRNILIALLFIGCTNASRNDPATGNTASENSRCDTLQRTVDSLKRKLFVSNFKLERVRYYLSIAENKPSQSKFLKGWVKRAVDEETDSVQNDENIAR